MPGQPDVGDVHVNQLLTNISVAHYNQPSDYIADQVFPVLYHAKQSDLVPKYDKGFFFADEGNAMLRAPGTKAVRTGFKVSTDSFFCQNWAVGFPIPDELRANQDSPFDMDRDGTLLVTELIRIRRERAWATDHMTTGIWSTDTTVPTKWNDVTSDPLLDVTNAKRTVRQLIGRDPNVLVMGRIVWDRLKDNPEILDRIKGGSSTGNPAVVNKTLVAQLFEVEKILVGEALYRSTAEGAAVTLTPIMDDDALLVYVPPRASLLTPAAGYTFVWESMAAGRGAPQYTLKYREGPEKMDVIEEHTWFDHKILEPGGGVFFSDVVD
jgi:Phage major capsid protein E